LLAGRLPMERPAVQAGMAVVMALATAGLCLTRNLAVVASPRWCWSSTRSSAAGNRRYSPELSRSRLIRP